MLSRRRTFIQSFLLLLLFVFSLRSRVKENKEIYFKIKEKQVIHKCVTKIFHAGLLLFAPSHGATQPPHRSQKPTKEEAPPGQALALIHQTRCKKTAFRAAACATSMKRVQIMSGGGRKHLSFQNCNPVYSCCSSLDSTASKSVRQKKGNFLWAGGEK